MSDAVPADVTGEIGGAVWVDVADAAELQERGKLAVAPGDLPLVVLWVADEQRPVALHDVCIHKQRNLSEGVVLNGRLVCPGHQWSFDLATGHCAARDRYQPAYRAQVVDGRVHVDVSAPIPTG